MRGRGRGREGKEGGRETEGGERGRREGEREIIQLADKHFWSAKEYFVQY